MEMKEFEKYCINVNCTLRDALAMLNDLSADTQTLIAVDENNMLKGTLTDGDIRRGLINGSQLTERVSSIMHTNCKYLYDGNIDVVLLKQARAALISLLPIISVDKQVVDILNLQKYKSLLPIDAVIMAGGKGERLRPLTLTTPKPLLPVGNKAIIDHNVDRLIAYGVKNILVTVNYLAEQLEEHYSEPHNGVQIQCVHEPKFFGTMGAVRLVKQFQNDVILVMNSDLFTDIDFEDMYLHFMENNADMSVAAVPYNVSVPYGIFNLEGRNIIGLQEKPVFNYYANAGIYLIKISALSFIPKDEHFDATDLIDKLVSEKKSVIRYPLNGTWIDIGTMSEYQKAQDMARHTMI